MSNETKKMVECMKADESVKQYCVKKKFDLSKLKDDPHSIWKQKAEVFTKCKEAYEKSTNAVCQSIATYASEYYEYLSLQMKVAYLPLICYQKDENVKKTCSQIVDCKGKNKEECDEAYRKKNGECQKVKEASSVDECKELAKVVPRYIELYKKLYPGLKGGGGFKIQITLQAQSKEWKQIAECWKNDPTVKQSCVLPKYDLEKLKEDKFYAVKQNAEMYGKCKSAFEASANNACKAVASYAATYYEYLQLYSLLTINFANCKKNDGNVKKKCGVAIQVCTGAKRAECLNSKKTKNEECQKAQAESTDEDCKTVVKNLEKIKELMAKLKSQKTK